MDERDDPANWPEGAPWEARGFSSAEDERAFTLEALTADIDPEDIPELNVVISSNRTGDRAPTLRQINWGLTHGRGAK